MSLQYIIDGYNIIHHPTFIRSLNRKIRSPRLALLELITSKKLTGSPKNRAIVIFDGYPDSGEKIKDITLFDVIFSKTETADERIRDLLEKSANPKNIVVVSDDKEIIFFARALKAVPMSVEEFLCAKEKNVGNKEEILKSELSYSQIDKINKELRDIWLKQDGKKN